MCLQYFCWNFLSLYFFVDVLFRVCVRIQTANYRNDIILIVNRPLFNMRALKSLYVKERYLWILLLLVLSMIFFSLFLFELFCKLLPKKPPTCVFFFYLTVSFFLMGFIIIFIELFIFFFVCPCSSVEFCLLSSKLWKKYCVICLIFFCHIFNDYEAITIHQLMVDEERVIWTKYVLGS